MATTTRKSSKSLDLSSLNLGGISVLEIAVLGAAGFIAYRNREKLMGLLSKAGFNLETLDIASIIPEQYRNLAKVGGDMLNKKFHPDAPVASGSTGGRRIASAASAKDFQ
jgi:hypothetical protein